jgi:hypothetical protein
MSERCKLRLEASCLDLRGRRANHRLACGRRASGRVIPLLADGDNYAG